MFGRFNRHFAHATTLGRRAFAAASIDNGKVIGIAAVAGIVGGTASSLAVWKMQPPAPVQAPLSSLTGPQTQKFEGKVEESRSKVGGEGSKWTKPVVIAGSPGFEPLAKTLRKRLGSKEFKPGKGPTLDVQRFKSNDCNIRFNWERVVGRKVVFLFDTVDQERFFEQLSLLQALQGFAVPDGGDKRSKWKTYVNAGTYKWGRASHVLVVIPWYRPCQMERSSRWAWHEDNKWTNAEPDGKWLDVPNALLYARLLCTPGSVPPLPGPTGSLDSMPLNPLWRPPVELLFLELHEEAPVLHSVSDLGASIRVERFVPYFLDNFRRKKNYPGQNSMYILFPDRGAFDRYHESVRTVMGLDDDHIMFIQKVRVGEQISQVQKLFYGQDEPYGEKTSFVPSDHVLIIDDFTNSGSTLFGAVNLVKKMTEGDDMPETSIFVSHLVALYDEKVVEGIKEKITALGPKCKFFCTNTISSTTSLLKDHKQVEVVDISDYIADIVHREDILYRDGEQ